MLAPIFLGDKPCCWRRRASRILRIASLFIVGPSILKKIEVYPATNRLSELQTRQIYRVTDTPESPAGWCWNRVPDVIGIGCRMIPEYAANDSNRRIWRLSPHLRARQRSLVASKSVRSGTDEPMTNLLWQEWITTSSIWESQTSQNYMGLV